MSQTATPWPDGPEFDLFLRAPVGEDRNGAVVTVFSTLARLDLDPRKEASDLAALPNDAALLRLDSLLGRFVDVPTLGERHHAVAQGLILLLPHRRTSLGASRPGAPPPDVRTAVMPILWTVALVILIGQLILAASVGPGE